MQLRKSCSLIVILFNITNYTNDNHRFTAIIQVNLR